MCGIIGIAGQPLVQRRCGAFPGALQTIAHRGPDGEGIFADDTVLLGHRRLAVIDLSDAGLQPMAEPESGLVVVFNGEIYNYLELRSELQARGRRFRSATDTEVLLHGYLEWGLELFARCNGMWALAIWDPRHRRVVLSRDRFGVKPLVYAQIHGGLAFASEPKALHALDPALLEPDGATLAGLLLSSRLHDGARTLYRGMHALEPGHSAVYAVESDRLAITRYWEYPIADPPPRRKPDPRAEAEEFGALFEDAVRLRLRSDVPVGLTLSGGLDSSAVLAASRAVGHARMRCFTAVYDDAERAEEAWAQIAAGYADAALEPVQAHADDWLPLLRRITHHLDGPGYSPAVFPLWAIMRRAREQSVPVLLEGQGADELLGGYPRYSAIALLDRVKQLRAGAAMAAFAGMRRQAGLPWATAWLGREASQGLVERISADQRARLLALSQRRAWRADVAASEPGPAGDLFEALRQDHAAKVLPALLHYGDAVSMAHGIESRLPFMDYRLVEWVFRARPALIDKGISKLPVRAYLRAQAFEKIADRRDKLGFLTPLARWFATHGRAYCASVMASDHPVWTYLDRDAVARLLRRANTGSTRALFHVYKVLTIALWLETLRQRSLVQRTEPPDRPGERIRFP